MGLPTLINIYSIKVDFCNPVYIIEILLSFVLSVMWVIILKTNAISNTFSVPLLCPTVTHNFNLYLVIFKVVLATIKQIPSFHPHVDFGTNYMPDALPDATPPPIFRAWEQH